MGGSGSKVHPADTWPRAGSGGGLARHLSPESPAMRSLLLGSSRFVPVLALIGAASAGAALAQETSPPRIPEPQAERPDGAVSRAPVPRNRYSDAKPVTLERFRSVFASFDLDNDGSVSKREARAGAMSTDQFRDHDLDGDRTITLEEFDLSYGKEIQARGQFLEYALAARIAGLEKLAKERRWTLPDPKRFATRASLPLPADAATRPGPEPASRGTGTESRGTGTEGASESRPSAVVRGYPRALPPRSSGFDAKGAEKPAADSSVGRVPGVAPVPRVEPAKPEPAIAPRPNVRPIGKEAPAAGIPSPRPVRKVEPSPLPTPTPRPAAKPPVGTPRG